MRAPRRRRGARRRLLRPAGRAAAGRGAHPRRRAPSTCPSPRPGTPSAPASRRGRRRRIARRDRLDARAARRPPAGRPAARAPTARSPTTATPTPRASARPRTSSTPTPPTAATRAPRSAMAGGRIVAVACDGRSRHDAGLTLEELAEADGRARLPTTRSTSTAAARPRSSPAAGCRTAPARDFEEPEPRRPRRSRRRSLFRAASRSTARRARQYVHGLVTARSHDRGS